MASRELSPGGILAVVVCTGGLGAYAYAVGGPTVGLLGALGGALLGFAVFFSLRAVRVHRSLQDTPAPQVLSLPPEQALSVLSAMVNRDGGGANLASEVLARLSAISDRAEADLTSAIVEAEDLRRQFPRSPAVPAALARLHRRNGEESTAATCAADAIRLAVNGGMNAVAARTYAEHEEYRDQLRLGAREWEALARVLDAREQSEAAEWARQRGAAADENPTDPD